MREAESTSTRSHVDAVRPLDERGAGLRDRSRLRQRAAAPSAPKASATEQGGVGLGDDGRLAGRFEIAPPGKPEEFALHLDLDEHRAT